VVCRQSSKNFFGVLVRVLFRVGSEEAVTVAAAFPGGAAFFVAGLADLVFLLAAVEVFFGFFSDLFPVFFNYINVIKV
jgi:hypothetical protein